MSDYQKNLQDELKYLSIVSQALKNELAKGAALLSSRKSKLISSRKEMWNDTAHFLEDSDRLAEIYQYVAEVNNQTAEYKNTAYRMNKFEKALKSPYFGRFDFHEEGFEGNEKIYIGVQNVTDSQTGSILVYDWRAPISSIFYQHELGRASYKSPMGVISGEVLLKRQYKIENSELKYFFDCSIKIDDEILQDILGRNSSAKMRTIVESIQKEQDRIIRDTENELLIVQGVAGSGKTSIALHRIAYFLYHGLNSDISSRNIMIISPNTVFSNYISSVLPELGEENVEQMVFEDYAIDLLKEKVSIETRNSQLEFLIASRDDEKAALRKQSIEFKGSKAFFEILNRLVSYYEQSLIPFTDIYYDGQIIETRQNLKNLFIDNRIGLPAEKRLKRIENMILEKIHPLQKERVKKIEGLVQKLDGHEFEIKQFSRLLSIKEMKTFLKQIRNFSIVDYSKVYQLLFKQKVLFNKLAYGLELPSEIKEIITGTTKSFEDGCLRYEDCAPLFYLKLRLEGSDLFSDIRHVVIDEAQDYSPIQYEIFKLLFKDAYYTVLGDINQSIGKDVDESLYDGIEKVFSKRRSLKVFLKKSYRSSYEINAFAGRLLSRQLEAESFERHEAEPAISFGENFEDINSQIARDIRLLLNQNYESIAVICKTSKEAEVVYDSLKRTVNARLVTSSEQEIGKGVIIIPVYMAKGLEFDAVLAYNVSGENYYNETDKRLLYIACTRALHRLSLYCTGSISPLINNPKQ